jgi:hypothetical protein
VGAGRPATSFAYELLANCGEDAVSFIEGSDRGQTSLLPPCIDGYLAPEASVRVVQFGR